MPAPEGYRKALRLMELAERFNLPIITFIDTLGLIRALVLKSVVSQRLSHVIYVKCHVYLSQSFVLLLVKVALAVLLPSVLVIKSICCNTVLILISPEGCASILWEKCR